MLKIAYNTSTSLRRGVSRTIDVMAAEDIETEGHDAQ
jgi:hypothetical protein